MFLSACVLAVLPGAGTGSVVTSVAPANGGKLLFVVMNSGRVASGAKTGWVNVWDTTRPELKAVIPDLPADVRTIQPTADGKRFTLIAGDRWNIYRLEVWDTATQKRLHRFEVSEKDHGQAVVSPDGNWLAYRPGHDLKDKLQVWNTETGTRAEELEKTASRVAGWFAFSPDSKRLIVGLNSEGTEFEIASGKKTGGWKLGESPHRLYLEGLYGSSGAVIPGNKGVVLVSPTAKRRQSYVVQLMTEKKELFLGEFWDFASSPVVSPDGRWIAVRAGTLADRGGMYLLKLDADGNPALEEKRDRNRPPFGGGDGEKVYAWRELPLGSDGGTGRALTDESLGLIAFSPDGKRVFASVGNEVRVFDPETLKLTATV